jgi:catechol 2,3-dioxygenase-like lactoylglutathione lyase family enzyme
MSSLTKLVAFLTTTQPSKARAFFEGALGFRLVSDDDFALVFDTGGPELRVVKARAHAPAEGTVLGWQVDDVHETIRELVKRGVRFERYGMPQDEDGVWTAPGGAKVAWFKDPDGNVLSITEDA